MEYRVGDIVVLKSNRAELQGWAFPAMNRFLGAIIRITGINGTDINFDGCESWYISLSNIERYATFREIADYLYEHEPLDDNNSSIIIENDNSDIIYKTEDIRTIANEVWGEDRVDVRGAYDITITVHFPNVRITNSKDESHIIRELFVKFTVDNINPHARDGKASILLWGRRQSWTLKEIDCGYSHSHLPIKTYGEWSVFCLGSSDFAVAIQNLSLSLNKDDWYLVFYSLENYIRWESLEGGPYKKIATIEYSQSNLNDEVIKAECDRLVKLMNPSFFEYDTTQLIVNANNPAVYNFFNKHSTIRRLQTSLPSKTKEQWMEKLIYEKEVFYFKNVIIPYDIIDDEVLPEDNAPIEQQIVNSYVEIINKQTAEFAKNYSYECIKQQSKNTIRENNAYQFSHSGNNRENQKADRLSSQ